MKDRMSVSEVSELCGVPVGVVRDWCQRRVVQALKVSGGWSIETKSLPGYSDPNGDDRPLDLGGECLLL
jgi:hypothetical protein